MPTPGELNLDDATEKSDSCNNRNADIYIQPINYCVRLFDQSDLILLSQVISEQQQKLTLIEMYTISECNICDIFWN